MNRRESEREGEREIWHDLIHPAKPTARASAWRRRGQGPWLSAVSNRDSSTRPLLCGLPGVCAGSCTGSRGETGSSTLIQDTGLPSQNLTPCTETAVP